MEKTIGKRIAENRKRLSMTQDALAEQLGVTAQAVSKWENDQSCPDITMLPKLAEIFGISTDELLGCPVQQRVLQGEVVDESAEEETEKDRNLWELNWEPGKRVGIAFAVLVLLVGGLLLAATLCHWETGFWGILWPSALLVYGIFGFTKRFSFFRMSCTVFGGYFLVSNLGLWRLEGDLVFPAILVLLGISLLVDALSKPKRSSFKLLKNGKTYINGNSGKTEGSHREEGTHFTSSLSFGDAFRRAELPVLSGGEVSVSFGEMTLDLSGCGTVTEDCRIEASCSFGELTLLVPKKWQVLPHSDTAFASLNIQGEPLSEPEGRIVLMGNVSFGEICVQYV